MATTTQEKVTKFIKKWNNFHFSTGSETGDDYKSFQRQYRNVLKAVAVEAGYELYDFIGNHYDFSAILNKGDSFVYVSISDVRFWANEWYTNILYRRMRHATDWTGMENHFSTLENLVANINRL